MATIHIWGGGPYHPTRAQAERLAAELRPLGHDIVYGADRSTFDPGRLRSADLLLLCGLDWSGRPSVSPGSWVEPGPVGEPYTPLSAEHFGAIVGHLNAGKPLLCLHSALLSFDERPEFTEVYDGRWIDGRSSHPPYREFMVRVRPPRSEGLRPPLEGIGDFAISDEIYMYLREPERSAVLLETEHEGRTWPLAWAGTYGESRVLCCALGHDMGSFSSPELPRFLVNGVRWLLET